MKNYCERVFEGLSIIGIACVGHKQTNWIFISEEDFAKVDAIPGRIWLDFNNRGKKPYAVFKQNGKLTLLHRYIMDCPVGLEVDHFSGETLDCRRCNLRIVSHQENIQNNDKIRVKALDNGRFGYRLWHNGKEFRGNAETYEQAEREFCALKGRYHSGACLSHEQLRDILTESCEILTACAKLQFERIYAQQRIIRRGAQKIRELSRAAVL